MGTIRKEENLRGEVKGIPYPETYPSIFQNNRQEEKLSKVEGKVKRKEGVGMNIKSICPFDF